MPYLYLSIAILAEVAATTALKASEEFTRLWPSVIVVIGYSIAFYCLSLSLKTISVGVAYAIWTGVGMVLITLAGWWLYDQKMDAAALVGMAMIVAGVAVMQIFSSSVSSPS